MPASAHTAHRALVVEDDPLFATLYRETLATTVPGIRVDTARNGYAALLHLAQHRPDIILLDLHMPGFDGFEFLDIVKRKHALIDVPVLVVSSAIAETTTPLRALPHVFVFAKPLRPSLLQKLIRQTLGHYCRLSATPRPKERLEMSTLEAFVGPDHELQREIARQFYELAPDRVVRIEDCLRKRDYQGLREWCHTLTGTGAMIGAELLQQLLARCSQQLAANDDDAIKATVEAIIEEIRQIAIQFDRDFDLLDS